MISVVSGSLGEPVSVLVNRLQRSQLYQEYHKAFEEATGLPLAIRKIGSFHEPLNGSKKINPFCVLMAGTNKSCAACLQSQEEVEKLLTGDTITRRCHAGLMESAVPVRVGNRVVCYLQTGQIRFARASRRQRETALRLLTHDNDRLDSVAVGIAYDATRVIGKKQYAAVLRMLSVFADHLGVVSNQIALQQEAVEMPVIARARIYIGEHKGEKISLGEVSHAVNMSAFYFCKVFKKATGLTFTQYLARVRIEEVKGNLLGAHSRISEAAYASGFQSLSQFNRVFSRVAGESPSNYRHRVRDGSDALPVVSRGVS